MTVLWGLLLCGCDDGVLDRISERIIEETKSPGRARKNKKGLEEKEKKLTM